MSVTGTEVTNVIFEGTQSVSQPPTDIPTIDGLFTIIEEAISEPNKVENDFKSISGLCMNHSN